MRPRLGILLAILFFLGFPLAGLVFVWKYAHANIERSAAPVGRQIADEVLSSGSGRLLDELGTLDFRNGDGRERFDKQQREFGRFVRLTEWEQGKTAVGQKDDMIWQVVHFTGVAQYEKADVNVELAIARRTMNPEWRVESLELRRR